MRQLAVVACLCVAIVVACGTGRTAATQEVRPTWSTSRAGDYLDARAQLWFESRPCALSCHTTHPYLLASDSPLRGRILDTVRSRVRMWPEVELWYDMDRDKVLQSRGTEAVLNAFALVVSGRQGADSQRALDILFDEQRDDGGWHWLDFGLAPFESADAELAGAAFAAIAVGTAGGYSDAAKLERLRRFLAGEKRRGLHLHNKLMLVWASQKLDGILSAEEIAKYAASVVEVQRRDGGFSLADLGPWKRTDGSPNLAVSSDGYATAFVAYVLDMANLPKHRPDVERARVWLRQNQLSSGGWPGRSLNDNDEFNRNLMSDAATAYAVMALESK